MFVFRTGIVAVLLAAGMVGGAFGDLDEILDFSLPEYDDEGNKVSLMVGERARLLEAGLFEITNLRIEFYKKGKTDVVITTPLCRYNQDAGTARSKARVRMEKEGMVLTGKGFAYDRAKDSLKIRSNVKVVIKNRRGQTSLFGEQP